MANNVLLAVKPPLTEAELNDLFAATWPGHIEADLVPVVARSLAWVRPDSRTISSDLSMWPPMVGHKHSYGTRLSTPPCNAMASVG